MLLFHDLPFGPVHSDTNTWESKVAFMKKVWSFSRKEKFFAGARTPQFHSHFIIGLGRKMVWPSVSMTTSLALQSRRGIWIKGPFEAAPSKRPRTSEKRAARPSENFPLFYCTADETGKRSPTPNSIVPTTVTGLLLEITRVSAEKVKKGGQWGRLRGSEKAGK